MNLRVVTLALVVCGVARADEARSLLTRAQTQFQESNYEQALKLYKQAQAEGDADAFIEYNIGLCHLRLGDGDKATQHFESAASRATADSVVQRDALFNLGVIRAAAARQRLEALVSPEPAEDADPPPMPASAPQNIEALQDIAGVLLRAIALFQECERLEPTADAQHNIRAVRITRRNVLGLLKEAAEAKDKQDLLNDPQAYLQELIEQQRTAASLTGHLILNPPETTSTRRQARRSVLKLQRRIMERTDTVTDHLAQFTESGGAAQDSAEKTPREQLYHAVAEQLDGATVLQRDAAAFLMDDEIDVGYDKQLQALDGMFLALQLFPPDPRQVLVQARTRQAALRDLVSAIKSQTDWLQDPRLGRVSLPEEAHLEPSRTALHYDQAQLFTSLSALWMHLQTAVAAESAEESTAQDPPSPELAPEIKRQLADLLKGVTGLRAECLQAIENRDQQETISAQQQVLDIIDAALDMLPKSIEQRIAELVAEQARVNEQVKAQAGGESAPDPQGTALDELNQLASQSRAEVLGGSPAEIGERVRRRQQDIRDETESVHEDLRQQIAAGSSDAAASPGTAPTAQSPQVQAYIEASKHVEEADLEMLIAVEGLDKVIIQDSLGPLGAEGPVQTAQATALEELLKALAALRPPEDQPQDDDRKEQQDQQQDQEEQSGEDARRAVERADQQREQAEKELYQRRPRTVIKDW